MPRGVPRIPEPREWVLTKKCTVCAETKPWALFSPMAYWEDGSVRRVYAYCKECDSKRGAERKRKYRRDNLARFSEYNRAWKADRRRALEAERTSGGRRLPSPPLTALILRAAEEEGEMAIVAEQCQMQERILRRVMAQEHVTLRLADEICTRLGVRLYDVYPELEEVAA